MSPLEGIKVVDLSRVLAGPWCTQLLADLGAEVVKIERPGSGDDTRHWGPPWIPDGKGKPTADSAYFASTNRGKLSLAIDFTKAAGQQLIRSLALRADVLIENFKVGTLDRYRLGYESMKGVNPRLVYCSISAYGQDGPAAAERPCPRASSPTTCPNSTSHRDTAHHVVARPIRPCSSRIGGPDPPKSTTASRVPSPVVSMPRTPQHPSDPTGTLALLAWRS